MHNYPRIIAEMARLQWAITPEAMEGLKAAVESGLEVKDRVKFHQCSEDEYKFAASELGRPVEGTRFSRVRGDVGSLLIAGPIVPRADAFTEASGLVSIDRLTSEFRALEENPAVERIMMVFDSPGGAITGISEFSAIVAGCAKHVTAYVQGSAASAAYWIASAADTIVSSPTGLTGSIGVVMTVRVGKDDGKIEIVSAQSPNKRPDIETKEGRAEASKVVDGLAEVFVDTVAANRGVAVDKVLADFGKGAVMVASRARTVGMIDRVDTLVNTIKAADDSGANVTVLAQAETEEKRNMPTLQELLTEHPSIRGEIDAMVAEAREAGATAGEKEIEARVNGATPYLSAEDYPKVINTMALDVVAGTKKLETLIGSVAVYDALKTEENTDAAIEDSDEQPDVHSQTVAQRSTDGVLRSAADMDAEIAALKEGAE